MDVELVEECHVVVSGAKEECVVYVTALGSSLKLILQRLQRGGLRYRVGHLEIRGDATSSCCTAFTLNVCLLRHTRLAEMYVCVDDAWQNETP